MRTSALLAALLSTTASACVENINDEVPTLGAVVDDCVVPGIDQAPRSLAFPEGSLWIWEGAYALVTDTAAACAGDFTVVDEPLVQLLPEEQASNAARADGRSIAVSPLGGFVHEGRGYLYYDKQLLGPGLFDLERLGTGVCELDGPTGPCTRTTPNAYAEQPSLLWLGSRAPWGRGAFVDTDGFSYLYGCTKPAAFEETCTVARVRPTDTADPTAYRVYNAFNGWIEGADNPTTFAKGTSQLWPSYNPQLGQYAFVTPNIFESTFEVRLSDAPAGDITRTVTLFDAVAPESWFIGGGSEHPALGSGDGRTIAVSYSTDGAVHLVQFRYDAGR